MNFISTTDLRTKSSELVSTLNNGGTVSLIHRSKIIAVIKPAKSQPKVLTKIAIKKIQDAANKLNLPNISNDERANNYQEHLTKKYGKDLL